MIELKNICFTRDNKKILDNINLILEDDAFYVITGPNGSGKSTLAKIIMGLTKPDSGEIIFNGVNITDKTIEERSKMGIGFAFQQPVCFKGITVFDLLGIATNKKMDKQEACSILSKVGLCALEYIDREVNKSLSGGELKRIEIATVLARNPKLAIFDEPEAGIDLWSFNNLTQIFKEIHVKGRTTIIISHQERIFELADKIILMGEGKVKKFDSKDNIQEIMSNKHLCCLGGGIHE